MTKMSREQFPYVGQIIRKKKVITANDISKFIEISDDSNPVHLDDLYARKVGYKARIAHGFISISLFSGMFGTDVPGEGSIYVEQNVRFLKPVYLDEEILAVATVLKISQRSNIVVFRTECFGAVDMERKLSGQAKILMAGQR